MIKAIETNFVPVAIYNNVGGKDRVILKRFGEPSWNFQVVRFLNAEGKDIIARRDRIWTKNALMTRIQTVLKKTST